MVTPVQLQSVNSTSTQPSPSTLRRLPVYLTAAGAVLVLLLFVLVSTMDSPDATAKEEASEMSSTLVTTDSVNGVEYFHCAAEMQDDAVVNLVLLHGAAFTKKNWKKSGILDKLCHVPKLSVTALDLDHHGDHKALKQVLDGMRTQQVIQNKKPVALVTPSASGYSVVDWITTGSTEELVQYVGYWIPVASFSVKGANESALKGLKDRLRILAMYGSKDTKGKEVSKHLGDYSDAKVVEIEGGHPCYLDSPDDFIKELLKFLKERPSY